VTTYLLYVQTGREFRVEAEIRDMGLDVWCPSRVEFIRRGRRRLPEAEEVPALPNYLVCDLDAGEWQRLFRCERPKYLTGSFLSVPPGSMRDIREFRDRIDEGLRDACARMREIDMLRDTASARERLLALIAEYREGQALRVLRGPLADRTAYFVKLRESPSDYRRWLIEASVDMMGRAVPVELDPLDVAREG